MYMKSSDRCGGGAPASLAIPIMRTASGNFATFGDMAVICQQLSANLSISLVWNLRFASQKKENIVRRVGAKRSRYSGCE